MPDLQSVDAPRPPLAAVVLPRARTAEAISRWESPTVAVTCMIYGGFLLWALTFTELPLLLTAPIGAVLLAWYTSLQHETIHNHPTPWRRVNALVAALPLTLWIPYGVYRETHLRHHRRGGRELTEPGTDPESFYLLAGTLRRMGRLRRALRQANCTLGGRLLIGPALTLAAFWAHEWRLIREGYPRRRAFWLRHLAGAGATIAFLTGFCHIPLWIYALCVVYPSMSLSQIRSFAEHRAADDPAERTAVVQAGRFWGLLFLHNNLHIAHHREPKRPWYELPATWARLRHSVPAGAPIFRGGYAEVFARHLFTPYIRVEHPAEPGRTGD
jgi:fatty acid desaturase